MFEEMSNGDLVYTSHARSVFANSCCTAPRSRGASPSSRPRTAPTRVPRARPLSSSLAKNQHSPSQSRAMASENNNHHLLEECISSKPIPSSDAGLRHKEDYEILFKTLLENNTLLHNEVTRLKREHSKALCKLSHYYRLRLNQSELEQRNRHLHAVGTDTSRSLPTDLPLQTQTAKCKAEEEGVKCKADSPGSTTTPVGNRSKLWAKPVRKANLESEEYDTPEEFVSPDNESDKLSVTSVETYQFTYISSSSVDENEDTAANTSRYNSPGMRALGKMWDNFTVEDFSVVDFSEALPCGFMQRESSKSTSTKSKRSSCTAPSVTVPKPFKMTTREASTIKKKNRSMVVMENECSQKQAAEEAECKKQFHANPMPASTLLPLHDLINAKNEQRKEVVKRMSASMLKSMQKPFRFSKRDEEKREQSSRLQKQATEEEERRIKEMAAFKAKPMLSNVLDPAIDEKALEQEEYRRIRIQMRAEKLLANAKAPTSMQLTEARKMSAKPTSEKPKERPRFARKIPDYNKAYSKFQKALATKKQSKMATVSEPFLLHTEHRAKGRPPPKTSAPSHPITPPRRPVRPPSPAPLPPQMTETAKRRQLLIKEKMANDVEKEAALEEDVKAKQMRAKDVQKMVAQRSSVFDMTELLMEERKNKVEEFKQRDRKNSLTYRRHLEGIKKRVEARPLLLEQQASKHGVQIARDNYAAALKKVGFSENEVETLVKEIQS